MRVVIVGAGEVGRAIATNLEASHDVFVIDRNKSIVEELTYSLDVLALHGDGTELETLEEAGIGAADLMIACTDSDETNVVICGATKTVTDAFTIARVRRRTLLEIWDGSQGAFGVDFMVCTDLLTARAIVRICGLPAAQDVDMFAGGLVRMAEFEIGADSPVANQSIHEADSYDSMTFAAIFRGEEMIVASGDAVIEPGDRVVVIGSPESVTAFANDACVGRTDQSDEVVIVGGSEIGYQTAREFEAHGYEPTLIEQNHERARELAEALPKALVLESDPTDTAFLAREHIDEADIVIAALDGDEKNLLASLLARRLGVDRTIAIIENLQYADLFERVGIDVAINPREETAEEIVRFTRADHTEKIAMLEHDRAEVIEFEVGEESILTGGTIDEVTDDLPDGVVIGAISRGGERITPRGTTQVRAGDHIVVFVDAVVLDAVIEAI